MANADTELPHNHTKTATVSSRVPMLNLTAVKVVLRTPRGRAANAQSDTICSTSTTADFTPRSSESRDNRAAGRHFRVGTRLLNRGANKDAKKQEMAGDKLYIPGQITSKKLMFIRSAILYTSYNNPGADVCAKKVQEYYPQLQLTRQPPKAVVKEVEAKRIIDTMAEQNVSLPLPPSGMTDPDPNEGGPSPPPSPPFGGGAAAAVRQETRRGEMAESSVSTTGSESGGGTTAQTRRRSSCTESSASRRRRSVRGPEPTIMLLYLNDKTYAGKEGEKFVEELRAAQKNYFPILMLHENDPECGGCEVGQPSCRTRAPCERA